MKQHYTPTQPLSIMLLHSIAKKILVWVQRLGLDQNQGEFDHVKWKFPSDSAYSPRIITIEFEGEQIEIVWTGNLVEGTLITCSHENILDLSSNLDWFVRLEKEAYDTMERLETYLEEEKLKKLYNSEENAPNTAG